MIFGNVIKMSPSVYIFSFLVLALFAFIIYCLKTKKPKSSIGSNTPEIETKDTEVLKPASRGDSSISRYARPKDGDQLLNQSGYVTKSYTTSNTSHGHTSLQPESDFLPFDTPRVNSSISRYARPNRVSNEVYPDKIPRSDSSNTRHEKPKIEKNSLNKSTDSHLTKSDVSWHLIPDEFVIFDLETTGLTNDDPVDIIEISAIKVNKNKFQQTGAAETFTVLVKPFRGELNPKATAVNKITHKMIEDEGVDASKAIRDFTRFVGNRLLIAYNVKFDRWFLERELNDQGLNKRYKYKCALQLSRRAFPNLTNHRLTTVASYLGIGTAGAHRALQDCVMTLQVYIWCVTLIDRAKTTKKEKNKNEINARANNSAESKCFAFAGTFSHITQLEAAEMAKEAGMRVALSLSESFDFLVIGKNPGKKLDVALQLNKNIIDEDEFLTILLQEAINQEVVL